MGKIVFLVGPPKEPESSPQQRALLTYSEKLLKGMFEEASVRYAGQVFGALPHGRAMTAVPSTISPQKVDNLVKAFQKLTRERGAGDSRYCEKMALAVVDANDESSATDNVDQLLSACREGDAVVGSTLYSRLPENVANYYNCIAIDSEQESGHARFKDSGPKCFVVSPIGNRATGTRERSDRVFKEYIRWACHREGLYVERGDMMAGNRIDDDMINAIEGYEMVVAYLGKLNPPFNPNVFFEVGYRIGREMKFVMLCDEITPRKRGEPPINITNYRMIHIPQNGSNELRDSCREDIARTINERLVRGSDGANPTLYGTAIIDTNATTSVFTELSRDARRYLLEPDHDGYWSTLTIEQVMSSLISKMCKAQRKPFGDEQGRIQSDLFMTNNSLPIATIPIVLERHANGKFPDLAYLPLVVRHSRSGGRLKLRLSYLDVTKATKRVPGGYYLADLGLEPMEARKRLDVI